MSTLGTQSPQPQRTSTAPHIPGEAGAWVFIFGDMCVFALLFGTFIVARAKVPGLFDRSQADLHRTFGAVNTLLLLTSSLSAITAVRGIRADWRRVAPVAIGLAIVCGCAFLVNKGFEWGALISDGHTPGTNDFYMYFFVLTGIHALHVVIGLCVLGRLFVLSRKETLTPGQMMFVEGGACFWHMVDLLWIVLFALLYLVR